MTNPNLVQNGGFEQSSPPALPPFWSGSGETQTGGTQLLRNNSALLAPGETITQTLLPLQAGEHYQFQAAFSTSAALATGTIDVDITGISTRKFQAIHVPATRYGFYNFDFIATGTAASLAITNNSDADLRVDVVSVKLTNPNLVQNGGFEQSSPPALPPFWSGSGETQSGGTQLLRNNSALLTPGETITQTLLSLQAGEHYQFQAAFSTSAAATGTIDVDITGISTHKFQAAVVSVLYTFNNFNFIAAGTTASLIITNNSDVDLRVDVVSVKLTNPNLVQNGGFEQSSPPALPPFWSGSGETQSGGTQLLGDNSALLAPGETINQTLLSLQAGEHYQFQAAFSTSAATGTIDVDITGISTRKFQADNVSGGVIYAFYNFDFIAAGTTASLIITNNSELNLKVDVVSVKLA